MAAVRLYESQIRYLRERAGVLTLQTALTRYRLGELVTEKQDFETKPENLLPYSLHRPITGFTALEVRAILFASMRNPVNTSREQQMIGDEIDAFFDSFANIEYFKKES
jgi:hypothetical protein